MSSKLDQALGDIIDADRAARGPRPPRRGGGPRGGNRGQSNGGGAAAERRQPHPLSRDEGENSSADGVSSSGPVRKERSSHRSAPYSSFSSGSRGDLGGRWTNDLYQRGGAVPPAMFAAQTQVQKVVGDTIHITSLHHEVTAEDLQDIFSPLGAIRSCHVHYDHAGRATGTATITFRRHSDAERAVIEFDGAAVDGRTMHIKLVGDVVQQTVPLPVPLPVMPPIMTPQLLSQLVAAGLAPQGAAGRSDRREGRGGQGGGSRAGDRDTSRGDRAQAAGRKEPTSKGGRGAGGGGRGRGGRQERAPVKAEDLDAEMDSYQTARTTAAGADGAHAVHAPADTAAGITVAVGQD